MNKRFCLIVADKGSIKGNTDINGRLPPSQKVRGTGRAGHSKDKEEKIAKKVKLQNTVT